MCTYSIFLRTVMNVVAIVSFPWELNSTIYLLLFDYKYQAI